MTRDRQPFWKKKVPLWKRILKSTPFSIFVVALLILGIVKGAYHFTQRMKAEPDFGGMVTLRQSPAETGTDSSYAIPLSRKMVYDFVTARDILLSVAQKYHWELKYEDMVDCIDVRERLSAQNSFVISVTTGKPALSRKIAHALAARFLGEYQKNWKEQSRKKLDVNKRLIDKYDQELTTLKNLKRRFQETSELRPVKSDLEVNALNAQLATAQEKFMTAYSEYVSSLESKQMELQMELDLALQSFQEDTPKIRLMKRQIDMLDKKTKDVQDQMRKQKPDIYKLSADYKELTGFPSHIIYAYSNVCTLQQTKLALLIDSLIAEKETILNNERKAKLAIERMLGSNSCDVFIRDGAR